MKVNILFAIVMGVVATCSTATWAAPFVCVTGDEVAAWAPNSSLDSDAIVVQANFYPSCESLGYLQDGIEASLLIMEGSELVGACSSRGGRAKVLITGARIGLRFLKLVVGHLPCEDLKKAEEVRKLAEAEVCKELAKQGVRCAFKP